MFLQLACLLLERVVDPKDRAPEGAREVHLAAELLDELGRAVGRDARLLTVGDTVSRLGR